MPFTATAEEFSFQNDPAPVTGMKVGVPLNLEVSIPPRVSSADPTELGVRKRLKRAVEKMKR